MAGRVAGRVLVAALGSTLRGDDGFGPALLARVGPMLPDGVDGIEFGTHGIALVQKLYAGYDALIVLDSCVRGQAPGTIYVLVPDLEARGSHTALATLDALADTHLANPGKALMLARELGVLPPTVWLVGCEPERSDGHHIGLSDRVARALAPAARETLALLQLVRRNDGSGQQQPRRLGPGR